MRLASSEWVTSPEQGKSMGRIAAFSVWTGMFQDSVSSIRLYRCDWVVIASFVGTRCTMRW